MGKHAIIVIKNDRNEYIQYFDEEWNSYLFLNCKLDEDFNEDTIEQYISEIFKMDRNKINCNFIGEKIHTKFSESAKKEKEYQHYFFTINFELPDIMKHKFFNIDNIRYCWYSYDELKKDERIQKVNSDIINFIKEFNL